MRIDNSPARGMRDLLPADVAVRDHVLASIVAVYRRFGYQRIETPALENIERLSSGEGADNEKLIFEVLRRGLPPEMAAKVGEFFRACNSARFAPPQANGCEDLPTAAESLILALESEP